MTHTPEFRADRLAWRFRKSGADGHCARQYSNFDDSRRKEFLQLAAVGEGELPAIGCYFDANNWVLVTHERLIWTCKGLKNCIGLGAIADATVGPRALLAAGTKKELTELTVVGVDGQHYQLQLEAGPPFSGFWNALKMVAAWNVSQGESP